MSARRQVAAAAVISMAVIIMGEQQRHHTLPTTRVLIAWGFVFFTLSALGDFGVDAAGGLAVLVMLAVILGPDPVDPKHKTSYGEDALQFISGKFGGRVLKFGPTIGSGDRTIQPEQPLQPEQPEMRR